MPSLALTRRTRQSMAIALIADNVDGWLHDRWTWCRVEGGGRPAEELSQVTESPGLVGADDDDGDDDDDDEDDDDDNVSTSVTQSTAMSRSRKPIRAWVGFAVICHCHHHNPNNHQQSKGLSQTSMVPVTKRRGESRTGVRRTIQDLHHHRDHDDDNHHHHHQHHHYQPQQRPAEL